MLVIVIYLTGFSAAQAAILDWVSGSTSATDKASVNLAFGLISSFLGRDNPTDGNDKNTENMPIAQNRSDADTVVSKNVTKIVNEIVVAATAYSSTPDQTDSTPFITASNTTVRDGIVATNFLPFGTKVKIPDIYGDKIFVVEDRMNRRYWHTIDIWFPDRQSALEFGFKKVKIQILES